MKNLRGARRAPQMANIQLTSRWQHLHGGPHLRELTAALGGLGAACSSLGTAGFASTCGARKCDVNIPQRRKARYPALNASASLQRPSNARRRPVPS